MNSKEKYNLASSLIGSWEDFLFQRVSWWNKSEVNDS
jgi:hypothetical protein